MPFLPGKVQTNKKLPFLQIGLKAEFEFEVNKAEVEEAD
jgi:hypothetical protein